ncbi:DnaJ C-terminal domain-containing protein [Lichenifustis flavocetrariae]|uniref:DnaJ domain-containing protein n=1 Tax=Lichenifustis flavocetrariae TaxID=2949735 RepID=A0AA41ZAL9_9HYPH|nr:DnaJ C-terminal domain-containing protein [Lichenifustis flavocetrariae]MCW6512372.1 DnaJ domain-containing protein [Lichenifustis flavocetrariae]
MADDPYKILGVASNATDKEIRSAFLKLAKTSHPDLHPGDAKAEERFKAANAANDLLTDPERRARFDRGEIDGAGQERPPQGPTQRQRTYRDHAEGPAGRRYGAGFGGGDDDLGDILSGMFGARGRQEAPRGGADRRYSLSVPFLDAARGTTQRLVLPEGGSLEVRISPGLESGQVLRLRGKGAPGDPPGNALIEVEVAEHPLFTREGRDIHLALPVTVAEAVLGGPVSVPTIAGPVTMTIPVHSESGTKLRLRGKGVPASAGHPAGDAYVTLRIVLGPPDEGLAAFLRDRKDPPAWDPRKGLEESI